MHLTHAPYTAAAEAAAREVQLQFDALAAAEYGKWKGFYRGEIFVNIRYTQEVLPFAMDRIHMDRIQGKTVAEPPQRPDGYKVIKAYQGDRRTAP
jgi:hypothetical protein